MANRIIVHPPHRGIIHEFETTAELLRISDVKEFSNPMYGEFYRFSISAPNVKNAPELILMVEYDGGEKWWVIGYIDKAEGVELPKWEPKENDHDAK